MLSTILAGTARHRRPILGSSAIGLVCCLALRLALPQSAAIWGILTVGVAVLQVSSLVAMSRSGPAAFVVDPWTRSFRIFPQAARVYQAVSWLLLAFAMGNGMSTVIWPNPRTGTAGLSRDIALVTIPITVGMVAAVLVAGIGSAIVAWHGLGLRLTPEGLVDQRVLGTLALPWEALTPGDWHPVPKPGGVLVVVFARPWLTHREGLVRPRWSIRTCDIDWNFFDAALRYYLAHPERRSAIGTPAGYEELLRALSHPTPPATSRPNDL